MAWISENEFTATVISKTIAHLGDHASYIGRWLADLWQVHGEKIIAAAGVVFGAWKWWRNREQILHKRLEEYLHDSDKRLIEGQDYLLEAIQRPGPGQSFKLPLFANGQLQAVLRERRWDSSPLTMTIASSADIELREAAQKIKDQLETAEQTINSLREQLATSQLLRGAIAAAAPLSRWENRSDRERFALTAFRSVLQIPGHEGNVLAKELEAHQLRKLGQLPAALRAYEEVEVLAAAIEDPKKQQLSIARAKRYRAETLVSQQSVIGLEGEIEWNGLLAAWRLLVQQPDSAFQLRRPFLPFYEWDLLEHADMHYLAALLANKQSFVIRESRHLDDADTAYQSVLDGLKRSRWPFGWKRGYGKLRAKARAGVARVAKTRKVGVYDFAWLFPNLGQPQEYASDIHDKASNETVS